MHNDEIGVRSISQLDRLTFGIEWSDGHKGVWRLSHLRRNCPCAMCVEEMTRTPLLDPKTVADDMTCTRVDSVGRYAVTIGFSDGHSTGIFTFNNLRSICQCAECDPK